MEVRVIIQGIVTNPNMVDKVKRSEACSVLFSLLCAWRRTFLMGESP